MSASNPPLVRPSFGLFASWSAMGWEADSWEALAEADLILVLPFGSHDPKKGRPGASNKVLAALAEQHQALLNHERRVPIYTQWEIKIPGANYIGKVGDKTSTMEFLKKLIAARPKKNGRRVILYAHPHHLPRSYEYLVKLGFEVVVPPSLSYVPWDEESTQWWTRGPILWSFREVPVRGISILMRWV